MAIEYKTRTQLVVEILREKILSGEIVAGQPLRQAALANELNVSRIPVRDSGKLGIAGVTCGSVGDPFPAILLPVFRRT